MKKKKLTYLLLVLVSFIWGYILYQVFSGYSEPDEPVVSNIVTQKEIAADIQADTFSIVANYRDPFLGDLKQFVKKKPVSNVTSNRTSNARNSRYSRQRLATMRKRSIRWPAVNYSGMIKSKKKTLAILKIGKEQCLLQEKEESQNVKLLYIFADSVQIEYEGEKKTIVKN